MRKSIKIVIIIAFCLVLVVQRGWRKRHHSVNDTGIVTFISLLNEMTDRESITRFPAFSLKQISSWDRTQMGPEDPKTWFNNGDYGYFIRKEINNGRDEYVIMDEKGPGCIVRWWIPLENTYKNRKVRIYFDGSATPGIEGNYHDLISGKSFFKEPFAFISSDERDSACQYSLPVGHPKQMGADLYFPIPFSKRCKITLDDNPFYYAINYRKYDEGIKIESFSLNGYCNASATVSHTAKKLSELEVLNYNLDRKQTIQPGEVLKMELPAGSNAVRAIHLKFDNQPDKQMLRSTVLNLFFDNKETGCCPVSEFFGGGVYLRPVRNWTSMIKEEGILQSNWVMPYKESACIQLQNHGSAPISVNLRIATSAYVWSANSMYFHTSWHEEAPIKTSTPIDWNYIKIEGKGVYAGDVLTIHAFSKGWWGEGDEKIYQDNEKFPSQLGTGLEDYYGYAWGMAHQFNSPYISVPLRDARGKADWSGYTTVSRIRLLDGIPFHTALNVNVEAWLHDSTVSYSNCTYWYAFPDATSNRGKEDSSLKRYLPDYIPEPIGEVPGKTYADPLQNRPAKPAGNCSLKYVGNHLDCLAWRLTESLKPLDSDKDNIYGTAGYLLINCQRFDVRAMNFLKDSLKSLPDFVESVKIFGKKHAVMGDSWLTDPKQPDIKFITGAAKIECKANKETEILQISFNNKVPETLRFGVMTDNLDEFSRPGMSFRVVSSDGGDSGLIPLVKSNRFPDWYFFDLTELKSNSQIKVIVRQQKQDDIFTLGAITFDLKFPGN